LTQPSSHFNATEKIHTKKLLLFPQLVKIDYYLPMYDKSLIMQEFINCRSSKITFSANRHLFLITYSAFNP